MSTFFGGKVSIYVSTNPSRQHNSNTKWAAASPMKFCFARVAIKGDLITPTGRFKASDVPTNGLYLRFTFDFTDASDATITELGVMVGTQTKPDLPKGQRYFTPQDLTNPGILLVFEKTVPLIRTAATRETFTFVVTF